MKHILLIMTSVLVPLLINSCPASDFKLENGYYKISGRDGVINSFCLDPSGKGQYGRNHIVSMSVGNPIRDPAVVPEIDKSKNRMVFHKFPANSTLKIEQDGADFPQKLEEAHTIGQTFTVEGGFLQSIEAKLPTWQTEDSTATLTLYRIDGKNKSMIASRRPEVISDNEWVKLEFPDQPAGEYLLELSDVKGSVGWWSLRKDALKGSAVIDGKQTQETADRAIRCLGYKVIPGTWEIALDGSKLSSRFTPENPSESAPLDHRIVIPWIKSGYDTTSDKIIFSHFITDKGIYMPVHQLKRRPWSNISGGWVTMSGRFGIDIKFINAGIRMDMDEDVMKLTIPGGERNLEILPHSDKLSEHFPEFVCSDKKAEKVLNEFLLSHNFNFGAGTPPDWKDWHTLALAWTANPQEDWQHTQFIDYIMDESGYVYCWGDKPGWPFPFKDENNDGKNDFDTRHFTSNPNFILGAWREYCWNPSPEYLSKILPRCRMAMDFMLKECDGESGIHVNKADRHQGRDKDFGSNYWDILPLGHKDAFTNIQFYASLEAMAQLEEALLENKKEQKGTKNEAQVPSPLAGEGQGEGSSGCALCELLRESKGLQSPFFYRKLAEKVKKTYNDTFWLEDKGRYAGCVDVDGKIHDYGFTFINLPAMAYGLASPEQVKRIYDWMENGVTSSGKADTYSRWIMAPRASTIHNPKRDEPQSPVPSWWCMDWSGTGYDDQCQDGGAILYTSFHDILARARYLGADNAWKRLTEILDRYSKPDHLSGGSPLYLGESTQGGPGGSAGSVGVEGEFPESGLVPVSFLYAFIGVDTDIHGLKVRPSLPSSIEYAGVKKLRYGGRMYDITVTKTSVEIKCTTKGHERTIKKDIKSGETAKFTISE